jgi:hypothetical protein
LLVGASADWFEERANERGWDKKKVPMIAIEEYIKVQRGLFDASMAKLESAIEVAVNVEINQDFVNRIEVAKRQQEARQQDALTIQFGVKPTQTQSSPFFSSIEDKMENMNVRADGTASVDFVDTAKNPLFGANGMDMDDIGS